jgi:hypothetical protein
VFVKPGPRMLQTDEGSLGSELQEMETQGEQKAKARNAIPWWLRRLDLVRAELKGMTFPRTAEEGLRQCAELSALSMELFKAEIGKTLNTGPKRGWIGNQVASWIASRKSKKGGSLPGERTVSQPKESRLLEVLAAVIDSFKSVRVGYMIIGAWALAVWGRPRATMDLFPGHCR